MRLEILLFLATVAVVTEAGVYRLNSGVRSVAARGAGGRRRVVLRKASDEVEIIGRESGIQVPLPETAEEGPMVIILLKETGGNLQVFSIPVSEIGTEEEAEEDKVEDPKARRRIWRKPVRKVPSRRAEESTELEASKEPGTVATRPPFIILLLSSSPLASMMEEEELILIIPEDEEEAEEDEVPIPPKPEPAAKRLRFQGAQGPQFRSGHPDERVAAYLKWLRSPFVKRTVV